MRKFAPGDAVWVKNPGSVYHGKEGVVQPPRVDDDGMGYGMVRVQFTAFGNTETLPFLEEELEAGLVRSNG
jgi:hypothetical protein